MNKFVLLVFLFYVNSIWSQDKGIVGDIKWYHILLAPPIWPLVIEAGYKEVQNYFKEKAEERTITPLHKAVIAKDINRVRELVSKRKNINTKDYKGDTPLQYAIKSENYNYEIAELLIQNGAEIEKKNLTYIISNGNIEILKLLISGGLKVESSMLYQAFYAPGLEMVQLLIRNGADINQLTPEDKSKLLQVVSYPPVKLDKIKFLVEHGASVNSVNQDGWTPLGIVIYGFGKPVNLEAVRYLIKHKTDIVNFRDNHKRTLLHLAIQYRVNEIASNAEIIKLLIENGVDPNLKDDEGNTIFDFIEDSNYDWLNEDEEYNKVVSFVKSKKKK